MKSKLILCFLILFFSCSQQPSRVKQFKWLEGTWVSVNNDTRITQTWKKSDHDLKGENNVVVDADTVFSESILIGEVNDTIVLYTRLPGSTASTEYKLIKGNDKEAIFENIFHDYPQRILYRKIKKDSLYSRIEGENKGRLVHEEYFFARKK
jgi:hypothetical protein